MRAPAAAVVGGFVLLVYLLTLAPTVTLWDAGEFITAARVLGIPHPPAAPAYVLLGHAWGLLVPLGEYAWRLNLLSAACAAAAAAAWFLVVRDTLRVLSPRHARLTAAAAAVIQAFTFTAWQNATETEVYAPATLLVALVAWACLRWRRDRGSPGAARWLLLVSYLLGLAVGNSLLTLLAGPAAVAFVLAAGRSADDRGDRRQAAALAATWLALSGAGTGRTAVAAAGVAAALAVAVTARRGDRTFAPLALLLGAIGASTYLFLLVRAGQGPVLNEGDPSTWRALLEVVGRAQYGVRSPFDDPTVPHGPGNPGRSAGLLALQLQGYLQYFGWQWGSWARAGRLTALLQLPAALLFAGLGLRGLFGLRHRDRPVWWFTVVLFLGSSLGLVLYLNFKPGFSLGWAAYPEWSQHEVRERDYFFVASFVVWGLWAGLGLGDTVERWGRRFRLAPAAWGLALVPLVANLPVASRRHGPDTTVAADLAWNLLNSVPPYGILFTYGDNDTFPLWWAQEVQGIRRDVTVVCLSLADTDWYPRQLRGRRPDRFDGAGAPAIWRQAPAGSPPDRLLAVTDAELDAMRPVRLGGPRVVDLGGIRHAYPAGTVLYRRDELVLRILAEHAGRRPIAWAATTGDAQSGLGRYLVRQGLALRWPDSTVGATAAVVGGPTAAPAIDLTVTTHLALDTYRYGGLAAPGRGAADPPAEGIAGIYAASLEALAGAGGDSSVVIRSRQLAARLRGP